MKKNTFDSVVPLLKGQGVNASALRLPCLSLSAVTISLHYLPRCLRLTVTCGKMPNKNLTIWGEHYKICYQCYCNTIKTNSKTIRL